MRMSYWSSDVCSSDLRELERPSDPLEQPAIGDAHRPLAVADAEFLVMRVPAHRAVAEDERRRRTLARINLQLLDRLELRPEDRGHQVVDAERSDKRRVGKEWVG